jgi:hypothetical protein
VGEIDYDDGDRTKAAVGHDEDEITSEALNKYHVASLHFVVSSNLLACHNINSWI